MSNITPISQTESWAIQKAVQLCDKNTISRLNDFYIKSSTLENEYKSDAINLIRSVLKINHSGETKKDLTNLLLGLGFKKSNVSKMIEATRFTLQLEREKSEATDWVKSLPVSTAYVLATCEEKTFSKVWAQESEWGSKPVTQKQVETLKQKIERPSPKSFATETISTPSESFRTETNERDLARTNLHKALKLVSDYPDIVELIKSKLVC